jgi:hypothetical protein
MTLTTIGSVLLANLEINLEQTTRLVAFPTATGRGFRRQEGS